MITHEQAIDLARRYIIENAVSGVVDLPSRKLIPSHLRPTLEEQNDAWLITFPYAQHNDNCKHNDLLLLVDTESGEVSMPIML